MSLRLVVGLLIIVAVAGISLALVQTKTSAEEPQKPLLLVYWDTDFGGRCLEITGDLLDLPKCVSDDGTELDWNDQISSIVVVSGTWRLCQHGRANTEEVKDEASPDNVVARPVSGWSCLVSAGSTGATKCAKPEGGGWANDEISSIQLVSTENLPDWAVLCREKVEVGK